MYNNAQSVEDKHWETLSYFIVGIQKYSNTIIIFEIRRIKNFL